MDTPEELKGCGQDNKDGEKMRGKELKGALAFIGIVVLVGLLLFGFLLLAAVLLLAGLVLFVGFYAYVRFKLWRLKRHPPKELEELEDYF